MADPLINQQGLAGAPQIEGLVEATNLIVPPIRAADRLAHFSPDVFDLSSESHLVKFLKAMLGDAGAGRLAKTSLLSRLEHSIQGTHFFDLDSFYGALFGVARRMLETIDGNPFTDVFDETEWDEIALRDDSYRSRLEQFARAVNFGASPTGIRLMAEALLNVECDVYESFVTQDRSLLSYGDLESVGTYSDLSALGTYGDLESDGDQPTASYKRALFTVVPKRPITDEERYDLIRVLSVLKPAGSTLRVNPHGRSVLKDIQIRDGWADSEMWSVTKTSLVNGQGASKKRPPFTSYQGEAWTHLSSVLGVTSYTLDDNDQPSNWGLVGVVKSGGAVYSYTPDLALLPMALVLSGRAASDGVVVRHPYLSSPRNRVPFFYDEPFYGSVSRFDPTKENGVYKTGVWTDGYAILDSGQKTPFSGGRKTKQFFWATPERAKSDPTREVFEVKLRSVQLVNHISMDLSRFPNLAEVEAWDEEIGEWRLLRSWTITDSFPQRITNKVLKGDVHPQHNGPDHWVKCSASVSAVRTSRVRVTLKRNPAGSGPSGSGGVPINYSLAIRNFDLGYRLRGRSDIPSPEESLGGVIATTFDATGQPMAMSVSEKPAKNALDAGASLWRSEPQPTNRAVVSFYLDVRDGDGSSQVIDKLYLDPSRSGPSMNIYWSDSVGSGSFEAADTPVDYSTVGVVDNTALGLVFSDSDPAWLEVSNDEIQFVPSGEDWWFGAKFIQHTATVDSSFRIVWSDGSRFSLLTGVDPADSLPKVVFVGLDGSGNQICFAAASLDAPARSSVVVSVRHSEIEQKIFIDAIVDGVISTGESHLIEPLSRPSSMMFGGSPGFSGGNFTLNEFFLKVGIQSPEIESMGADFSSYIMKGSPGLNTRDYTSNSILRFASRFSSLDRIGLRGGAADRGASFIWHPIERDYKLAKGYVSLPPIRAKYLKLEFTNLIPEPMESMLPITRHVRVFPSDISGTTNPPSLKAAEPQWAGLHAAIIAAGGSLFVDTPPIFSTPQMKGLPPTAAQYVPEIQRAKAMREQYSWLYGMQPWQSGHSAPRFREVGPHIYNEFDLVDTAKIGFFVGLKEIKAFRLDFERDDDTPVYHERFLDDNNWIDGYTWNLSPGEFFTTTTNGTATSKVFRSRHPVRAVQFASQQSDPVQIIPDDNFDDPRLAESTWQDSSSWHATGDGQIYFRPEDQVVLVSRDVRIGQGEQTNIVFPEAPVLNQLYRSPDGLMAWVWDGTNWVRTGSSIISGLVAPVFSYRTSSTGPTSQTSGGIESGLSATSEEGMIHGAARVTAVTNTTNPIVLQLIGSNDEVLAEQEMSMLAGETKEWYVSYQLGAFDRPGYQLFEAQTLLDGGAPAGQQYGIMRPVMDHNQPDPTGDVPEIAPDALVRIRLIQEGASSDSWIVDRLSVFDESILWEFSVDGGESWFKALNIRSNPHGVLAFASHGNGLCWRVTSYRDRRQVMSMQVRPWYARQMGTVMGVPQRGPNMSAFDHEPPIHLDPEFKVWNKPVPKWWWAESKNFPIIPGPGEPLVGPHSAFYARVSSEDVSGEVGTLESVLFAHRSGSDGLDGDGFPLTVTYLPSTSDTGTAGGGVFSRGASSAVVEPDDTEWVSLPEDDAVLRRPVSPPPVAGD